ncbi:hypothetical protein [Niveispirillum fermenti]|uniref:hypothetical protein n=1 Tax=Niveispirillum fermenti TaxID=1233113 RepID=UPI003A8818E4
MVVDAGRRLRISNARINQYAKAYDLFNQNPTKVRIRQEYSCMRASARGVSA